MLIVVEGALSMKDPLEVLQMKEQEILRVKQEIEALRITAELLREEPPLCRRTEELSSEKSLTCPSPGLVLQELLALLLSNTAFSIDSCHGRPLSPQYSLVLKVIPGFTLTGKKQ
jgi:hypothetical protein